MNEKFASWRPETHDWRQCFLYGEYSDIMNVLLEETKTHYCQNSLVLSLIESTRPWTQSSMSTWNTWFLDKWAKAIPCPLFWFNQLMKYWPRWSGRLFVTQSLLYDIDSSLCTLDSCFIGMKPLSSFVFFLILGQKEQGHYGFKTESNNIELFWQNGPMRQRLCQRMAFVFFVSFIVKSRGRLFFRKF